MTVKTSTAYLILFLFLSSSAVAELTPEEYKVTADLLDKYVQSEEYSRMYYVDKLQQLLSDGVDVEEYTSNLLSDHSFAEYWCEALWLKALYHYQENTLDGIAVEVLDFLQRNETLADLNVIKAKMEAANILHQLVGPNTMKSEKLAAVILQRVPLLFEGKDPTDSDYWLRHFKIDYLKQAKTLSEPEKEKLNYIENTASQYLYLAKNMYLLTSDGQYQNFVERCKDPFFSKLRHSALFVDSTVYLYYWKKGRFELHPTNTDVFFDDDPFPRPGIKFEDESTHKVETNKEKPKKEVKKQRKGSK